LSASDGRWEMEMELEMEMFVADPLVAPQYESP
jgi:hypothetical protein